MLQAAESIGRRAGVEACEMALTADCPPAGRVFLHRPRGTVRAPRAESVSFGPAACVLTSSRFARDRRRSTRGWPRTAQNDHRIGRLVRLTTARERPSGSERPSAASTRRSRDRDAVDRSQATGHRASDRGRLENARTFALPNGLSDAAVSRHGDAVSQQCPAPKPRFRRAQRWQRGYTDDRSPRTARHQHAASRADAQAAAPATALATCSSAPWPEVIHRRDDTGPCRM